MSFGHGRNIFSKSPGQSFFFGKKEFQTEMGTSCFNSILVVTDARG